MKKAKKKTLHLEIMSINFERMRAYIDTYNKNAKRVTPKIKVPDIVNLALDKYLSKLESSIYQEEANGEA